MEGSTVATSLFSTIVASMGPSPFSDGRSPSASELSRSGSLLQWGHRLSAMEGSHAAPSSAHTARLQWGHRLSAMEGGRRHLPPRRGVVASMGPSPFSDGRDADLGKGGGGGEASMGPSPFSDGRLLDLPSYLDVLSRFNGAIAFQRWKVGGRNEGHADGMDASMGPSPFSDGRPTNTRCWRRARSSFNGAIAFQRWKGDRGERAPTRTTCCFNGAIAFQRWKGSETSRATRTMQGLQWGHRLSAMEGGLVDQPLEVGAQASMGPSPFSDGRYIPFKEFEERSPLQWGHRLSAMEGNPADEGVTTYRRLQWGHRLSAMEGCCPRPCASACAQRFNGAIAFQRWKVPAAEWVPRGMG